MTMTSNLMANMNRYSVDGCKCETECRCEEIATLKENYKACEEELAALKHRYEQMSVNFTYCMDRIGATINVINDDYIGTWQSQIEYVCSQARIVHGIQRTREEEVNRLTARIESMKCCANCDFVVFCGCGLNQTKCKHDNETGYWDMSEWRHETRSGI